MEKSAIPDGLRLRSMAHRAISDLGKPVTNMCKSSLKTEDVQVAGSGLSATPVFVITLEALHAFIEASRQASQTHCCSFAAC